MRKKKEEREREGRETGERERGERGGEGGRERGERAGRRRPIASSHHRPVRAPGKDDDAAIGFLLGLFLLGLLLLGLLLGLFFLRLDGRSGSRSGSSDRNRSISDCRRRRQCFAFDDRSFHLLGRRGSGSSPRGLRRRCRCGLGDGGGASVSHRRRLKGREKKDFEPVTFSEVDYQRMKRMNFFLLSRPCSTSKKKKSRCPLAPIS